MKCRRRLSDLSPAREGVNCVTAAASKRKAVRNRHPRVRVYTAYTISSSLLPSHSFILTYTHSGIDIILSFETNYKVGVDDVRLILSIAFASLRFHFCLHKRDHIIVQLRRSHLIFILDPRIHIHKRIFSDLSVFSVWVRFGQMWDDTFFDNWLGGRRECLHIELWRVHIHFYKQHEYKGSCDKGVISCGVLYFSFDIWSVLLIHHIRCYYCAIKNDCIL